jgi:hypothetical protein
MQYALRIGMASPPSICATTATRSSSQNRFAEWLKDPHLAAKEYKRWLPAIKEQFGVLDPLHWQVKTNAAVVVVSD